MASMPSAGLVGDQLDAGVVEVEPLGGLGRLAAVDELLDGLDAELGHLHRVLLAGGADEAAVDLLDTVAAAVDRDDDQVLGGVGGLERLYAP